LAVHGPCHTGAARKLARKLTSAHVGAVLQLVGALVPRALAGRSLSVMS